LRLPLSEKRERNPAQGALLVGSWEQSVEPEGFKRNEAVVTACHHYDSSFVHLPPGGRHRTENIKAVDVTRHHYDGEPYIDAFRRTRAGGNA